MKNKILIFSGPTAVGKTSISIEVAKVLGAEIVNFDSLLFYKELNIGTAKPNQKEMRDIPHHLVGSHSIYEPINAAGFFKEAIPIINKIHEKEKPVVLVGGSGFYLQTILNGMYESTTTSQEVLNRSDSLYKSESITPFREILKNHDIESFQLYHENDHYRIRRAVEHYWMTANKFSSSRSEMALSKTKSPAAKYSWNIEHNYLDIPKEQHFEIIQARTDKMIEDGLIEETQKLLTQGATGQEKPMQSIGYKETISYIKGEFSDLDSYKERLSINTRRLAKSQRTWFKKLEKVCYNSLKDKDEIIKSYAKNR
jgi:tRNA dimethylallyltransferase